LTVSGLEAIVNIRATLNKGLTSSLIEAFPKTVAVARPIPLRGIGHHPSLPYRGERNADLKWILQM